jgi:hypothetical protein
LRQLRVQLCREGRRKLQIEPALRLGFSHDQGGPRHWQGWSQITRFVALSIFAPATKEERGALFDIAYYGTTLLPDRWRKNSPGTCMARDCA